MKLSPGTRRRVDVLFPLADRRAAVRLLEDECGTSLPGFADQDPRGLERVRFAALKLSAGKLTRLREAVTLAGVDLRNLLGAAGFGADVHAHEAWPLEGEVTR